MALTDEIKDFARTNGPHAIAYLTSIVRKAIAKWQENRAEAIASIAADREGRAEFEKLVNDALAQMPSEKP